MPGIDHAHIYVRVPHKMRKDLYKCKDPRCTHRTNIIYMEGREATCPYCKNTYTINRRHFNLKLPHCQNCTKSTAAKKRVEVVKSLERILAETLGEQQQLND